MPPHEPHWKPRQRAAVTVRGVRCPCTIIRRLAYGYEVAVTEPDGTRVIGYATSEELRQPALVRESSAKSRI